MLANHIGERFANRLTLGQLAQQLGVHPATTGRWAREGVRGRRLHTTLIGGRRFVLIEDLEDFLAAPDSLQETSNKEIHSRFKVAGMLPDGLEAKPARPTDAAQESL